MTEAVSAERIILSRSTAARVLDVSPRTFDEWRKLDGFPQPVPLPGYPRWRECDIRAWIDSRVMEAV